MIDPKIPTQGNLHFALVAMAEQLVTRADADTTSPAEQRRTNLDGSAALLASLRRPTANPTRPGGDAVDLRPHATLEQRRAVTTGARGVLDAIAPSPRPWETRRP